MADTTTPPVTAGDIIDLDIIGLGRKGDGIGKIDNFVVIVPNTEEGTSYQVEIKKVHPTVAFGVIHDEQ